MRDLESFKKIHSKSEGHQLKEKIFATFYTHTIELGQCYKEEIEF